MNPLRKAWRQRRDQQPRAARRPQLEELESRNLLSGFWTQVTNFAPEAAGTMMLLSDGTVMAQGSGVTNHWFKLSPDAGGSYSSAGALWSPRTSMGLQRQ